MCKRLQNFVKIYFRFKHCVRFRTALLVKSIHNGLVGIGCTWSLGFVLQCSQKYLPCIGKVKCYPNYLFFQHYILFMHVRIIGDSQVEHIYLYWNSKYLAINYFSYLSPTLHNFSTGFNSNLSFLLHLTWIACNKFNLLIKLKDTEPIGGKWLLPTLLSPSCVWIRHFDEEKPEA